jgi:hypothetical protein
MGETELREQWLQGGPWQETEADWRKQREAALPELREIVARFIRGESGVSQFRSEMDSFGKRTKFAGFQGASGQMFLNTLVRASSEDALAPVLRAALPAPADDDGCKSRFTGFLRFVDEARGQAKAVGVAPPSPGYVPFFLSFFWDADSAGRWPI